MANCAIVGINWGDEGKGRMVDLLTSDYDVVVRYQGGGNAGHTVVNDLGKFALHLLPSGIFRQGVVNILGNGVALDCENLWNEMQEVMAQGVAITPENLKISDRASLLLPWHRELDAPGGGPSGGQEVRLHQAGHRPVLFGQVSEEDHHGRRAAVSGEALGPWRDILEWKNLTLERVYGAKPYTMDDLKAWVPTSARRSSPISATPAPFCARPRQRASTSCLRRSWVPCGIWTTVSTPTPPPPTPSRPMPRWAPASPRQAGQDSGCGEGLFLLRGRGPLHLRVVR